MLERKKSTPEDPRVSPIACRGCIGTAMVFDLKIFLGSSTTSFCKSQRRGCEVEKQPLFSSLGTCVLVMDKYP